MPSITITVDANNAQRLQDAYQWYLRRSAAPTLADVQADLIAHMKGIVRQYQQHLAEEQAAITDLVTT